MKFENIFKRKQKIKQSLIFGIDEHPKKHRKLDLNNKKLIFVITFRWNGKEANVYHHTLVFGLEDERNAQITNDDVYYQQAFEAAVENSAAIQKEDDIQRKHIFPNKQVVLLSEHQGWLSCNREQLCLLECYGRW